MKPLYLTVIFAIIVAAAAFTFGYATHMAQLSRAGLSPEQIREELKERDTELQALRDSLDNEIERNNHLEAAHQQNEEQSAELSKRHDELTKSFATYRTEAEKDRIKMKKMELLLMSYAQPATHEEIRNLKAFFAAIEAALSEDEQIRWQKLESFRKMKQLLKRLPHQGL